MPMAGACRFGSLFSGDPVWSYLRERKLTLLRMCKATWTRAVKPWLCPPGKQYSVVASRAQALAIQSTSSTSSPKLSDCCSTSAIATYPQWLTTNYQSHTSCNGLLYPRRPQSQATIHLSLMSIGTRCQRNRPVVAITWQPSAMDATCI
eukprot:1535732-Amphidinium_carterae.1